MKKWVARAGTRQIESSRSIGLEFGGSRVEGIESNHSHLRLVLVDFFHSSLSIAVINKTVQGASDGKCK